MSSKTLQIFSASFFVLLMVFMPSQAASTGEGPQTAATFAAQIIISGILSAIAAQLLAKDTDNELDDRLTTLAKRGSYTNWFVGTRKVSPVFCWAGDRETAKEPGQGGGKGGPRPKVDVAYEAGWHVIGVGPVGALHQIIQSGKVIFDGPVTQTSHPSGSTIDLGKEGAFSIYWGEPDQPINTFLGDASRLGISSRWPHACYIVWNKKRLSGSTWPLLEYVVERRVSNTLLTQSAGWYEAGKTLSGIVYTDVTGSAADADPDVGYIQFRHDITHDIFAGTPLLIQGMGFPNGDYNVLRATLVQVPLGPYNYRIDTQVFLQEGTAGVTSSGSMEPYNLDLNDGANIAHITTELLFADSPQGLQLNPSHMVETWDLDSLESFGVEAEADGWISSLLGSEAETAESLLGKVMQDHGVLLPIDTSNGSLTFQRVRYPTEAIPSFSDNVLGGKLPEIETRHGEPRVDRVIYAFADRAQRYTDMTIVVDDDGQASFMEHQRARKVTLDSTVHFDTAASLAELRSPEELSAKAVLKLDLSRGARDLLPGQVFSLASIDETLRVLSVRVDPKSESVRIAAVPDFYGVPKSTFQTGEGLPLPPLVRPEQDIQFTLYEVPEQVLGVFPETQLVLIPRIRAHNQISFASLYLSRDDVTYSSKGSDEFAQTGGVSTEALLASGPLYEDQSIEYTEMGPDNGSLSDLSADLTSWGLGKQLCLISSSAGQEICFVQRVTVTGGTTRRLDGLLRARYDTRRLTHPVGAEIYLFGVDNITKVYDALLEPGEDLYAKTQPGTTAGQTNLSGVVPAFTALVGKAQVPIQPDYVQVRAPSLNVPAFQTGDNITVSWALSTGSPGTGCGGQSAGVAIGIPAIPGTVQIELLTTGDVVQSTISVDALTASEYEITNASLVSAFTSEPSAFKVKVTHIANGRVSVASPSLTITRV